MLLAVGGHTVRGGSSGGGGSADGIRGHHTGRCGSGGGCNI